MVRRAPVPDSLAAGGYHPPAAKNAPQGTVPDEPLEAVPLRHWGRWIAAVVVLFFAAALLVSLVKNPHVDWPTIREFLFAPLTLRGLLVTIELTIVSMIIGLSGGVLVALMRMSANPVLTSIGWVFVWFFRGTPLLVQILLFGFLGAMYPTLFLGIPFVGVVFWQGATSTVIGATTAAILALSMNEAAYSSEIVRAGIISVDKGQAEAAESLGLSGGQTMSRVVLPQAMRVIIPPLGNETISMLKMTALVSVISGHDLLTNLQLAYGQNFRIIPLLLVATFWYLFLVTLLSIGQHYLEAYFGKGFGQKEAQRAERRTEKREARHA